MSPKPPRRPRRGTRETTRERLVDAAAAEFNRVGYHGTDSNRLARAAGYAPATFYKHFADKREIFLAAYEGWVDAEWAELERIVASGGAPGEVARRIVAEVLALHRRWRGFRASLRALVAQDPMVRDFYRRQRRRQLGWLARLRAERRRRPASAEQHALLLFTLERVADAVAEGELPDLGVRREPMAEMLRQLVESHLD